MGGLGVCGSGAARTAGAALVDLTKPFEVDRDTIALYHLDDVASGEVKDAVTGGKPGKVVGATEAEGKFGKAMSGDGTKGWVDFADLPKTEGPDGAHGGMLGEVPRPGVGRTSSAGPASS